jgi:hypothetical protein
MKHCEMEKDREKMVKPARINNQDFFKDERHCNCVQDLYERKVCVSSLLALPAYDANQLLLQTMEESIRPGFGENRFSNVNEIPSSLL